MALNWLDYLGDINPQLFRELKGHLRWRNLVIAGAISLVGQALTLIYFYGKLPVVPQFDKFSRYCTGKLEHDYSYDRFTCLLDSTGAFLINWKAWWADIFTCLSVISVFTLLLLGSHLLVTDLAREERRGTLNFIRLSPRSTVSIMLGKLLGVPALLYLVALLVVPLHLGAGLAAQIPLGYILSWYGVVGAIVIMVYSAALVYGLATSWLGGFQPWLGSLGGFIVLTMATARYPTKSPIDAFSLLSPLNLLLYLVPADLVNITRIIGNNGFYQLEAFNQLQWMGLPIGTNGIFLSLVMVANAVLWTYWCWQVLLRQFRSPGSTSISKRHSYWLVICFELLILGFFNGDQKYSSAFAEAMVLNLVAGLGLVAALTPQRQTLYDWARYRHMMQDHQDHNVLGHRYGSSLRSLLVDFLWGERSPALLAIAINLTIAAVMVPLWILLNWPWWVSFYNPEHLIPCMVTVWLTFSMILVCAAIAQRLLLLQTSKRTLWAMGIVGAVVILPPIVLKLLSINPATIPAPWVLTVFPWVAFETLALVTVALGALGQVLTLGLLTMTIHRQLRQAGASTTKALITTA